LFSQRDTNTAGRATTLIVATLVLASCSLAQSRPAPVASSTNETAVTGTARTASNSPVEPRRAAPRATLADLMGAAPARIDHFLGRPEIVRREGPGELRLYRSRACVVHVFLYPRNGTLSAAHIEARNETKRLDSARTEDCIASFA
jgi:hypothetical protein